MVVCCELVCALTVSVTVCSASTSSLSSSSLLSVHSRTSPLLAAAALVAAMTVDEVGNTAVLRVKPRVDAWLDAVRETRDRGRLCQSGGGKWLFRTQV